MRIGKSSVSSVTGSRCLRKVLPRTLLFASTEKKKIHRERIVGFLLLAGVKVKKDITNPKCSWCSDGRVNFITDFIALGSVNRLREFAVLSVLASHHLFHRSLLTQLEKMELPKLS